MPACGRSEQGRRDRSRQAAGPRCARRSRRPPRRDCSASVGRPVPDRAEARLADDRDQPGDQLLAAAGHRLGPRRERMRPPHPLEHELGAMLGVRERVSASYRCGRASPYLRSAAAIRLLAMIRICSRSSSVAASTRSTVRSNGRAFDEDESCRAGGLVFAAGAATNTWPARRARPAVARSGRRRSRQRLRLGQRRQLGPQLGEQRNAFVPHQGRDLSTPLRPAEHADRKRLVPGGAPVEILGGHLPRGLPRRRSVRGGDPEAG